MNSLDVSFLIKAIPQLVLEGVPVALVIVIAATALGGALGLLSAYTGVAQPAIYRVLNLFNGAVRGTPPVLLLFIIYFGLPQIVKGLGWKLDTTDIAVKFLLVILATALGVAANSSEMFRSAYNSLDSAQMEAGKSLGYNLFQRFIHIIMPQALAVILPNIGNMLIQEVQNSSLIYYVGVVDIMGKAKQINANVFNAKSIELYLAAAIVYWVLCFLISKGVRILEKKMGKR